MKTLTNLLDKSKRLIENFDKDKFSTDVELIFENIVEYWRKYFGISEIKEKLNTYKTQLLNSENTEIDQFRIFIKLFKDNVVQDSIHKFFLGFVDFIEKFIFKTGEFDKNLYYELVKRISESREINFDSSKKIIEEYSFANKNMIEIKIIIKSILLVREIILEKEDNNNHNSRNKEFLILHFKMGFEKIISFLKNCNEDKFKIYLFDFLIKFTFIIESHIKNIMRFLLKLDNLLNNKDYNVDNYQLAKLFWLLKQDPIFRDYRNSVFHSDFIIKYDTDFNKRKIIFRSSKNDPIEWTIMDVFENFIKVILLVKTVDIFMLSLYFDKEDIINLIKEFFELINSEKEEKLLKELLEYTKFVDIKSGLINQEDLQKYIIKKIKRYVLK